MYQFTLYTPGLGDEAFNYSTLRQAKAGRNRVSKSAQLETDEDGLERYVSTVQEVEEMDEEWWEQEAEYYASQGYGNTGGTNE